MMRRLLSSLLLLVGCGLPLDQDQRVPTFPLYDPGASEIPMPNDALRDGELGRLDLPVDDETLSLLNFCAVLHEQSNGLFDPTSGVLRGVWDFQLGVAKDLSQLPQLLEKAVLCCVCLAIFARFAMARKLLSGTLPGLLPMVGPPEKAGLQPKVQSIIPQEPTSQHLCHSQCHLPSFLQRQCV